MNDHRTTGRRLRAASIVLALAMCLTLIAGLPASAQSAAQVVSPEVIHTGAAPTGYEVTFRYYGPTATAVVLRGEFGLRSVADATTRLPSQY